MAHVQTSRWRSAIVGRTCPGFYRCDDFERSGIVLNNITNATGGSETATGTTWLTAGFKTDSSTYVLSSVTLLLANTTAGAATLQLYSDGGLEPGSPLATLISPSTYSSTLAFTTFAASGITLSANTTYWLVLKATSGAFGWAWTTDSTGTGSGFLYTWGTTPDSGASWWTQDIYPTQFSLTVSAKVAADLNIDGHVDTSDLTIFLACRTGTGIAYNAAACHPAAPRRPRRASWESISTRIRTSTKATSESSSDAIPARSSWSLRRVRTDPMSAKHLVI